MFKSRTKEQVRPSLEALSRGLVNCRELAELDLSDNATGIEGIPGIQILLEQSVGLKRLKLNNNGLSSETGELLA